MMKGRSDADEASRGKPPMFWWTLANILAIAFAITSWTVCLNLFRDPTHPKSYELMMKVGRIDPLEAYTKKTLPNPDKTAGPLVLEEQFLSYRKEDRATLNRELMRAYLTNFKKPEFLGFVTGEFKILESRALSADDFLSPGVVVKAQALVTRDELTDPVPYPVFVEVIFNGDGAKADFFPAGTHLMLKKQPDGAAIIGVSTTTFEERDSLYLTVVPLVSRTFTSPTGQEFQIIPPRAANVKAGLPVLK